MDWPSVQFVDNCSPTANVRYDFGWSLEDGTYGHILQEGGLDLGAPPFSGEPGGVGGIYGYRTLRLVQRILGPRFAALGQMSALAREVVRPDNWLRVQWEADVSPVYFRTYATEPGALSLENANDVTEAWDITVSLEADPFAYGERVTLPTYQVIQGPADLTGPTRTAMRVVLPTIRGDAPTALRVAVTPGAGYTAGLGSKWLVGCIAGTTAAVDTVIPIGTGDGFSATAGTSGGVSDAAFFGGSKRTVTLSSFPAASVQRLAGTWPVLPFGRYKVLLRAEVDSANVPITFQLRLGSDSTHLAAMGSTVSVSDNGRFQGWVDLGEFQIPSGGPIPRDVTTAARGMAFALYVGAPTTATPPYTIDLDAFKLIPIAGPTVTRTELLTSQFGASGFLDNGTQGVFDGDEEAFYALTSGAVTSIMPALSGGFPTADPAADRNLLLVMAMSRSDPISYSQNITNLNAPAAVDVSYYPRWLYVGDGS